ncbi:hypothetical protein DRO35_02715, partial [Candidatus Bathyarchaeota archaeon]
TLNLAGVILIYTFRKYEEMPSIRDAGSSIPYIKELEKVALKILKENSNYKERLKEILEEYASRYSREYNIRT